MSVQTVTYVFSTYHPSDVADFVDKAARCLMAGETIYLLNNEYTLEDDVYEFADDGSLDASIISAAISQRNGDEKGAKEALTELDNLIFNACERYIMEIIKQ